MGDTSIEWTEKTWNPVVGCSKRSTGCLHCYAEQVHKLRHNGRNGYPAWLPWTARNAEHNVTLLPERLGEPLRWRKPRIIFVCSMSDLFHDLVPADYIARVFDTMAHCPQHVFQVLTKRPERARALLTAWENADRVLSWPDRTWPLPNVWMGTSIENRKWVGRADDLRATPAAVRFLSCEPLVGPAVKARATTPDTPRVERPAGGGTTCRDCGRHMDTWQWQCAYADCSRDRWPDGGRGPELDLTGIDWMIVGGESGHGHRPLDLQWVRDLRDASVDSGTAFFVKQTGGHRPGTKLEDLPEDLRIRELPTAARLALTP